MRTIPEVVEAVLNILNEAERTEECNGDTLCEINELMGEILVINSNIRNKTIDEAIQESAKAICIGCGYLKEYKCTYKGGNCGVSKPMLESVTEALEKLKK